MRQNEIEDLERVVAAGATFHTDKITEHGYFATYVEIAADIGPRGRVCEIGIWKGESLRMWQALFPLGEVTGVDFNVDGRVWPDGTRQVVAAQDDPRLPELLGPGQYDLIVDDASHMGPQTRACFGMLWPLVAPGGYYVIEDWFMALERPDGDYLAASVTDLARLLYPRDAECDEVRLRYGMAIARKRRS